MKLTTLGFGNGFKNVGKVRLESAVPPGYEWDSKNVKKTPVKQPAKPPVPAVRQRQKKSKILPKMQQRWEKSTYTPGKGRK